ncbi:MAG: hypothetical protein KCHDKBKB_02415 [Elusimicrobia bacterium]|nr:hypothetical protein [Elusimicrobiota bacterium]
MKSLGFIVMLILANTGWLRADENWALTRDEVTSFKRKLQTIGSALGNPPTGYEREKEEFELPTEYNPGDNPGKYFPQIATMRLRYGGGTGRIGQQAGEQSQDNQKALMEAMSAGDYEKVSQIQQKMAQQMSQTQQAGMESARKPVVNMTVTLNASPGEGIDPDNILFQRPGVIAIKYPHPEGNSQQGRVGVYLDPVALKNSSSVSTLNLRSETSNRKTAVVNAVIEMSGPMELIQAWAARFVTSTMLSQIDR